MALVPEFPDTVINNIVGGARIVAGFENILRPGVPIAIANGSLPGAFPTTADFGAQSISVGSPAITLSGLNTIILPLVGTYRVCFSLQLQQNAGNHTVTFWLVLNGTAIPNTSSSEYLPANSEILATVEFYISTTTANSALQLYLISDGPNSSLLTIPASSGSGFTIPISPAIVFDVEWIA